MPRTQAVLATRLPMPVVTNSVSFTVRCAMKFAVGNSSQTHHQSHLPFYLLRQSFRVAYAAIAQKTGARQRSVKLHIPKMGIQLPYSTTYIYSIILHIISATGNRQTHSLNAPYCSQKIIKEIKKRLLSIFQKKMQFNSKGFSTQFICGYVSSKVDLC